MLCSVAAVELMRHFKRIRSLLLQCVNIAHGARLVYGPNWPSGSSGPTRPSGPSGLIGPIGPIGLAKDIAYLDSKFSPSCCYYQTGSGPTLGTVQDFSGVETTYVSSENKLFFLYQVIIRHTKINKS